MRVILQALVVAGMLAFFAPLVIERFTVSKGTRRDFTGDDRLHALATYVGGCVAIGATFAMYRQDRKARPPKP